MRIGGWKGSKWSEMFNIEMLPAGHGDCICLEYGHSNSPHRILIDGGPYYAFKPLAKRVREMIRLNLKFDLLVITHVDCDHIDGILKLLGANVSSLRKNATDIWFNAWEQLSEEPADLLGPAQGEMLSALIEENKLAWNKAFRKKAVANPNSTTLMSKNLPGGLKLTLLSPTMHELANLKPVWLEETRKAGLQPGSRKLALELLRKNLRLQPKDLLGVKTLDIPTLAEAEYEIELSETNASSIAFLAEYDGKRCLFGGDAQPDVLSAAIQLKLAQTGEKRLKLDAFKLPHHGSKHNTNSNLLQLLDCRKFLVSSNGAFYHHPDPEAIARIITENGPNVELFFNYISDENIIWQNDSLRSHYRYEACYPETGKEGLTVSL